MARWRRRCVSRCHSNTSAIGRSTWSAAEKCGTAGTIVSCPHRPTEATLRLPAPARAVRPALRGRHALDHLLRGLPQADRPPLPGGRRRLGRAGEGRGAAGHRRHRARGRTRRRQGGSRAGGGRRHRMDAQRACSRATWRATSWPSPPPPTRRSTSRVFDEAERRAMLCNVVDVPPLCSFILPAIVRSGPIAIAISTAGASPALAKRMKREIGELFGDRLRRAGRAAERACAAGPRRRSHLRRAQGASSRASSTATPTRWRCCARATGRPSSG